jgi:c-di-GMP-binding flagellar brake protein YcgR
MNNNRKFDRFLLVTEIEQQRKDSNEYSKGQTKNISCGGICITTMEKPLDKGAYYMLRFTLPGYEENILETEAKAVWNRNYKSGTLKIFDNGLEFIDIGEDILEKIGEYKIGSVFEG